MEEKIISLSQVTVEFCLNQAKQFVNDWQTLTAGEMNLERMTGITNMTFKLSHKNQKVRPKAVIFRQFGKDCDGIWLNRTQENIVYDRVSKAGLGPNCFGFDVNVRVEQYIDSRVLRPEEMTTEYWRRKVAINLAKFHKVQVPEIKQSPAIQRIFSERLVLDKVNEKLAKEKFSDQELQMIEEMKIWLTPQEEKLIKAHLPTNPNSIVFSHNDLLANNVLISIDGKNRLSFIDFEYSGYNYRGYDIANYFNQSAIDYDVFEPPYFKQIDQPIEESVFIDFIKFYALFSILGPDDQDIDEEQIVVDESYFKEVTKTLTEQIELQAKEIQGQIKISQMLSHFYWGTWAIFMSQNPNNPFDYISLAYSQFCDYEKIQKTLK